MIAGIIGTLAELDCDIIIYDAPHGADRAIRFRAIVRAIPNLKDRQMFLKDMEEQVARKAQAERSGDAATIARATTKSNKTKKQKPASQLLPPCLDQDLENRSDPKEARREIDPDFHGDTRFHC